MKEAASPITIFAILLTILFIALKLTEVITWSWWLVLLPIIITTGLGILGIIVGLIIFAVTAVAIHRKF